MLISNHNRGGEEIEDKKMASVLVLANQINFTHCIYNPNNIQTYKQTNKQTNTHITSCFNRIKQNFLPQHTNIATTNSNENIRFMKI